MQRRRLKRIPLEELLADEARRLREEVESLPPGIERERAAREARQAEIGTQLSEWLNSPGQEPPK